MEHHQKLCSHFQAYYIPGLGGTSEADSAETIRILRETVFGLEFEESCIKFIPNYNTAKEWSRGIQDKKAIHEIAKLAIQHTKNRCGKVSFILFGHSNGGEVAVRVFEYLKDILPANDFKRVKRCSAVFTFGSPKHMHADLAEITLNALLRNDQIAEAGAATIDQNGADQCENFLYIGPVKCHKCQCCSNKSKAEESKKRVLGLSQQLMCSSNALSICIYPSSSSISSSSSNPSSSSISSSSSNPCSSSISSSSSNPSSSSISSSSSNPSSSSSSSSSSYPSSSSSKSSSLPSFSSTCGVGHYSSEYMSCRKLRLKIKEKLQITGGDIKCRCDD